MRADKEGEEAGARKSGEGSCRGSAEAVELDGDNDGGGDMGACGGGSISGDGGGIRARGGGVGGGGRDIDTCLCGGGDSSGGGGRSPSSIFLEQPLEREFTHFFIQMTARVCGRSLPLL